MPAEPSRSGIGRVTTVLHRVEDGLLALILTAMILLASAQIVLRNLFDSGLLWSDPLLRVMVLWLGLLGALAATRDDKHIVIDLLLRLTAPRWHAPVRAVTATFTAAVTAIIAYHATRFVHEDYLAGTKVFWEVPAWTTELILPLAFGLMTLRFALQALRNVRATLHGESGPS